MATAIRQVASSATMRMVIADRPGLPVVLGFAVTLAVLGVVVLNLSISLFLAAVLVVGVALNIMLANRPLTVLGAGLLGSAHVAGAVVLTLF